LRFRRLLLKYHTMNIVWAIIFLAVGLVILWKCAELLVAGAVGLAKRLGVSPLIIGLTIIAMGTSAPEVAASIAATVRNVGNIAIGNVYGSNIANLALVGGLVAFIQPIRIQVRVLRREIPAMMLVALLLWPVMHNLYLSRLEGAALLALFSVLLLLTVYMARKEEHEDTKAQEYKAACGLGGNTKKSVLFVVIGLAGLALGADITVRGAVFIGERLGMSQAVIGLTIIAIGTSLPELVTCIVAAVKKQDDISMGIMIGSNIFNALLAIGAAGLIRPFAVTGRLAGVDYWIMVVIGAAFAFMATIGRRISRIDGALLLFGYVGYMVYLLAYSG